VKWKRDKTTSFWKKADVVKNSMMSLKISVYGTGDKILKKIVMKHTMAQMLYALITKSEGISHQPGDPFR
jgi:hypothetical protein